MGWISISRVRHLDTMGGRETSQRRLKCFLNRDKASAAVTWLEALLCSGVLCQADGWEKKRRWNILYIYGSGETSAGSGSNSPNRVSSLLREQLLTHTCLSNVYRSWWRDNTGLITEPTHTHTHTLQPRRDGDTGHTPYLVLLSVGVMFPNPGGPCCPLLEQNPLMIPSKPRRHWPEHRTWPFSPVGPYRLSISQQSTCYYFVIRRIWKLLRFTLLPEQSQAGISRWKIHQIEIMLPFRLSITSQTHRLWRHHH